MILKIYKSRLFRSLIYFFIAIILNSCYSDYIVRDLNYTDIETSAVLKIYLKDGRTLDLTNRNNPNQITGFNENDITYKNRDGNTFKILKETIDHLYNERFSYFNTLLAAIGIGIVLFIGISVLIFAPMGSLGG